jgi:hypothetical protein
MADVTTVGTSCPGIAVRIGSQQNPGRAPPVVNALPATSSPPTRPAGHRTPGTAPGTSARCAGVVLGGALASALTPVDTPCHHKSSLA